MRPIQGESGRNIVQSSFNLLGYVTSVLTSLCCPPCLCGGAPILSAGQKGSPTSRPTRARCLCFPGRGRITVPPASSEERLFTLQSYTVNLCPIATQSGKGVRANDWCIPLIQSLCSSAVENRPSNSIDRLQRQRTRMARPPTLVCLLRRRPRA